MALAYDFVPVAAMAPVLEQSSLRRGIRFVKWRVAVEKREKSVILESD
jgi:hypothetical protein